MIVTSYSVTYCMYIPGKPWIRFHYYCAFFMSANSRIRFGLLIVFVCLYITHLLIIIIVQTYLKTLKLFNACQIYFVECVSKIQHILSVIHCTIIWAVCFKFTHIPCVDWENIYIYCVLWSSNCKYELLPIYRATSWNNGMRCMYVFLYSYHWKHVVNIVI